MNLQCDLDPANGLCRFCLSRPSMVCPVQHARFADAEFADANPLPLGDWAEMTFAAFGVTKEWFKAAKAKFGLPPECGCCGRQEQWNAYGLRLSNWWKGLRTPHSPPPLPNPIPERQNQSDDERHD